MTKFSIYKVPSLCFSDWLIYVSLDKNLLHQTYLAIFLKSKWLPIYCLHTVLM